MSTIERAMASVRKIDEILPIEGADAIEVARVGGWKVVVKKGEYQAGDLAVYCELDSWIPHDIAPFLSKGKEPSEYNGVKGERLKSIKLRGQISQGLLLPLEHHMHEEVLPKTRFVVQLGEDVTQQLGIQKWEAPVPVQLQGQIAGNFPTHLVPKTNQERVQNMQKELGNVFYRQDKFEVTEKLDGSSLTIICHEGEFRVCSRNMELKEDPNNAFWKEALKIKDTLMNYHSLVKINFAVQGELVSSGIQGNPYKMPNGHSAFYVFDIYNIDEQKYFGSKERLRICEINALKHVPVYKILTLEEYIGDGYEMLAPAGLVDALVKRADGNSVLNIKENREGVVFKSEDGVLSFKSISNAWLLKKGE